MSSPEFILSAAMDELLPQVVISNEENKKKEVYVENWRENFCSAGVTSICNTTNRNIQKHCKFYNKSFFGDHCMFFKSHQYCENPDAQQQARQLGFD